MWIFRCCGWCAVASRHQVQRVNVLEDDAIREGIKTFTNWPTIPQLYIKGEFVGGCDIIREMYETGELIELMNSRGINVNPQPVEG